ncbi:MAG: DNA repair protein RecO [Beijerinckiaceae bacterium]
MEWRDEGLIIGLRRHGETSLIVELMTRAHGRHLGVVKGGRSRRMQPLMQQGNSVEAVWRARLEEHLGLWQLDVTEARAASIMDSAVSLNGIGLLAELLRLLPERDPHEQLYEMALAIATHLQEPLLAAELMVRFELALLSELGFGIDLAACAATGQRNDLVYVSPKSARAVSRDAGLPYHDRLLALPGFLQSAPGSAADWREIASGFELTGHFLKREVFEARNIPVPDVRRAFVAANERMARAEDSGP